MKIDRLRADFEKVICAPPYEHMCDRWGEGSKWPGQYKRYETQLAWELWLSATERCVDIIGRCRVPVASSTIGEIASNWTLEALRDVRRNIR